MLSETLRRQEAEWENVGSEEGSQHSRDQEDGEKARLHTLGKVRILRGHIPRFSICYMGTFMITNKGYRPLIR